MKEEIKNELLEKINNGNFELLTPIEDLDRLNTKDKIRLKHNKCSTEYSTTIYTFLRRSNINIGCCPICKIKKSISDSEFKELIKNKFGDEWEILSTYKNQNEKILVKHKICNSPPYEILPNDLLRKNKNGKCKYCSNRKTINEIKNLIKNNPRGDGDEYEVISTEYISLHKKIKLKHLVCQNEFEVEPIMFLGSKNGNKKRNKMPILFWQKNKYKRFY